MAESNQISAKCACPRCGAKNSLDVGQLNRRGKLRWYETVNCSQCGLHREADGVGIPPAEIRQKLIELNGLWRVQLNEVKSAAGAVKVIRDALSLDMKDAGQLVKQLPGTLYSGTKEEAVWLIDLLQKAGESPVLEQN